MKPQSISEQMMYNTVRIETSNGSCGTGSHFDFKVGDIVVPVIITNKHVINDNCDEETTFFLHTVGSDGPDANLKVTYRTHWIFHKDKDICYCYIAPLLEEIMKRHGKRIYRISNDESIVPTTEKLQELSALEELVMVGYPIGLWDVRNNFPIFRKGYTACHPAIDFNRDGIGLVDIACFPGSSGSPIYILNEGGYKDKKGNTYLGVSRLLLLGYLFAGPTYDAAGELIIRNIPTHQKIAATTPIMANLGYYVKSSVLLEFKDMIQKDLQRLPKESF